MLIALLEYFEGQDGLRVRGDRDGDRLVLTFVLDEADRYHDRLDALNRMASEESSPPPPWPPAWPSD